MMRIKRHYSPSSTADEQVKKFRKITCLEDLSNELFYEIFDYLDGCDIHQAFSNLNTRFENFLTDSLLSLKLNLSATSQSTLEHRCRHVILPNKHRILSLHLATDSLIGEFFDYCHIDSSFNRLESIILNDISNDRILVILFYLNSLPQLSSLTIWLEEDYYYNLNDIYRLILRFPHLKYNKLSVLEYEDSSISLPMSINEKHSPIEHLVINFQCTLNELTSLLLHTPHLHYLRCENLVQSDEGDTNINGGRMMLPHLTHLSIENCSIDFDEFEIFIRQTSSQLQVLRLSVFWNPTYLDADQWKQLIKTHIPHLSQFYFNHHTLTDDNDILPNHESISRFTSSFWIKSQWVFELESDFGDIIFSIHPRREIWFNSDADDQIIPYSNINTRIDTSKQSNLSNQLTTDAWSNPVILPFQLTLDSFMLLRQGQPFVDRMKCCVNALPFTHLSVDHKPIPINMLIEIIHLLPNLYSLGISSLPLLQSNGLSSEDSKNLPLVSIPNKITKVKLDKMDAIEQVYFLMDLCPRMKYLEVECTTENDLENIVRSIIMNSISHIYYLNSLCICVPNANEKMVENLNSMIDFESRFHANKTITNYVLRRRQNKIYLNWKL